MNQQPYIYTGTVQQFTVPAGVTSLTIEAIGGGGGQGTDSDGCPGGGGGQVQASFNVISNDTLNIYIGGGGNHGPSVGGKNAYTGGGNGGRGRNGGSGGAATCITTNNNLTMLIIAGGGGGGAYVTTPKILGQGGYGGGNLNANGGNGGNNGGGGGTSAGIGGTGGGIDATAGGTGSNNGLLLGNGGIASSFAAGGGGGHGGGGGGGLIVGGEYSGAGGGSSFVNPSLGTSSSFSYVQLTTSTGGTYGAGGEVLATSGSGANGNSEYVLISWQTPPTPTPTPTPPISNICFPAGTPIKTDQGIINIDQIDTSYHTIGHERILDITQTVSLDKFLVKFPKDCLGPNWPCTETIMTKEHKVFYQDKLVPAYKFLNISGEIKRVKYNGETLYNVLMETHRTMNVNNLICETLDPNNLIAKIYKNRFTDDYNDRIIYIMNDSIEKRKYYEYKSIINRIHSATF